MEEKQKDIIGNMWTMIKQNVLVVAFSVLCTIGFMKACIHPKSLSSIDPLVLKPTTEYVKDGVVHEVIKTRELTQSEMNHITDSIRSTIKGEPEIKEVTKVVERVDTIFRDLPVTISGDTVETSKIDSYVTAKAVINTRLKQGEITLSLRDTLTQVRTVQKHFLRANTQQIDITNKNPYNKINAGSSIVVKEPKTLFVLGPAVVINPINQKVTWGISLTFNAFSIKCSR